MYMKVIGRSLWNELSVSKRNCCRENHVDLDCNKQKNKLNKDRHLLLLFISKIIPWR